MRFQVYTYDLWADGNGGYSVNDVYQQSTIDIPDIESDESIIRALKADGILKSKARFASFDIDGEPDYTIYVNYRDNPCCELRRLADGE